MMTPLAFAIYLIDHHTSRMMQDRIYKSDPGTGRGHIPVTIPVLSMVTSSQTAYTIMVIRSQPSETLRIFLYHQDAV